MSQSIRHPTRVSSQSGARLLTDAMHFHVQLWRLISRLQAELAQETRGHVRVRLQHILAEMRVEMSDLERAASSVDAVKEPPRPPRELDEAATRDERSDT